MVAEYSLTSDWDDRWRTGGTVDEVIDEAHLSPGHILRASSGSPASATQRLEAMRAALEALDGRRGPERGGGAA